MKQLNEKISIFLLLCLVLGLVVGCSPKTTKKTPSEQNTTNGNVEKSDADSFVLRVNTNMSEYDKNNSAFGKALTSLVEECNSKSNGRLMVEVFMNSQLGKSVSEVVGGSQYGAFEIFNLVAASWGEYTNAFLPVNVPYIFTNEDVLKEFMKGPQGKKIEAKVLEDTGAKVIFYGYLGFRNIINNIRPITAPEDLKGLKLRVLSDSYTIKAFESLGASTIQVPYSELYTSSQQGLIDGSDGPYVNIINSKLYEVQKYVSSTHNAYTLGVMCIAQSAYDNLPNDLKEIFDTACVNAQEIAENNEPFEKAALEELKEKVEFTELSNEQLQLFAEAVQPVYEMVKKELGDDEWKEIKDEITAIKERIE